MLHIIPLLLVLAGVLGPSVPGQAPSSQQGETDKRYAALMQAARGRGDPAVMVPQLEQFIRDCPDYPNLDQVYTTLLSKLIKFAPDRVGSVAEEFLTKFPGSRLRAFVYDTKFNQLKAQKDEERITALGLLVLETESNPEVLQISAGYDATHALQLLDKAIVERRKNPNPSDGPTLLDLRWSYAKSLRRAGKSEESLKMAMSVIDETTDTLQRLSDARDSRTRSEVEYLQEVLQNYYAEFVRWCADGGQRELALRYLKQQEQSVSDSLTDPSRGERIRGELYARLGVFDLALESLVRAFAQRMDRGTYDSIVTVAGKADKDPAEFIARARSIRTIAAKPAYRFDLKTDLGAPLKLTNITARVVLLNFFYPT